MTPAKARLSPGEIVGDRYRIEGTLGEGGMGVVYRATQLSLSRDVALKVMRGHSSDHEQALARFQREARVASALSHPNAVEIFDVGEIDGVVFLAMELIHGETLWDLLDHDGETGLPQGIVLPVSRQIADVLRAAHELPLVHRDLKPENVFVQRDAGKTVRARVVDFGLAFIEGDEGLGRMTREGLVVGTPAYLSPEQAQGTYVGPASDVYSLGCLLFEMATGRPPFLGSDINVLTQHIYVAPDPVSASATDAWVRHLDDVITPMLAKDPRRRPDARWVVGQLDQVADDLAGGTRPQRGRPGRRRDRMVDARPHLAPRAAPEENWVVGLVDVPEDATRLGLLSNGFAVERVERGNVPSTVQIVLALWSRDLDCAELLRPGRPVIVAAPTDSMTLLADLLRVGVAEVVATPIAIDELVRCLRRVQRRVTRSPKLSNEQ
ncbi:MAG: serine/threonine protein kinase [Myxococcales bacterium FL481]|nr:MAG: serine/threonine protein kinase [Myxococcales bacterium FL481]